jgi:hypothetical protein
MLQLLSSDFKIRFITQPNTSFHICNFFKTLASNAKF